ncbi:MAG: hypothetical protein HOL68_00005, partial [Bacteroidetes Order II. Incertae sedis bacterium]|nr:hypothetical protein [Bacteroidetes Order II. bacterium]
MPEIRSYEDLQDMKAAIEAKIQSNQERVDAIAENHKGRTIADQFALLSIVKEKIDRIEGYVIWANDRIENHADGKVKKAREQARAALIRWEDHQEALMKNINKVLLQNLPIDKPTSSFKNRHQQHKAWVVAEHNARVEKAKCFSKSPSDAEIIREVIIAYADVHLEALKSQFPKKDEDDLVISASTVL